VNVEVVRLVAWAAHARALAPAWREVARALQGDEAALARAMAEEWEAGWPSEVARWAQREGLGSSDAAPDPATAPGRSVEPRWIALALLAASFYDAGTAGAGAPGGAAEEAGELAELRARALAIEGPRAASWAQALGRHARSAGVESITRISREIDTSESWNLALLGPV
jgi:hypothetical protein